MHMYVLSCFEDNLSLFHLDSGLMLYLYSSTFCLVLQKKQWTKNVGDNLIRTVDAKMKKKLKPVESLGLDEVNCFVHRAGLLLPFWRCCPTKIWRKVTRETDFDLRNLNI